MKPDGDFAQDFKFDQVAASIHGIGMSHVERSGDRRQLDFCQICRVSYSLSQFGWHVFRKGLEASAGQVELYEIDSVTGDGLKQLLDRRAAKGLREDSKLHQRVPVTSATETGSSFWAES